MIQGKPLEVNNFNTTETPISFKQMLKYWIILYIRDKHLTDQSSKNTKYMYIELNQNDKNGSLEILQERSSLGILQNISRNYIMEVSNMSEQQLITNK